MKLFKTILSVMTIATIMVTGCNTIENTTVTNTDSETTDEKEENKGKDDYKYISEYEEGRLDLKNYSLDYVFGTDAQTEFIWGRCAKSEKGYYVWGETERNLCFIDSQTLEMVPLCNRPDCMHNDEECNAYFNDFITGAEEVFCDKGHIQYYDGYIYIVGSDHEYVNLYKVSVDGSTCEEYMSLYRVDLSPNGDYGDMDTTNVSSYSSPDIWIHRGYVYYIDNREAYPKIRRMKLGSDEAEIVYETGGERPNLYRMLPYGDYLFFQTGNYTDDTITESVGGIMAYNINTGEIMLVKKEAISSYGINNGVLYYYVNSDDVIAFDFNTCKETKICHLETSSTSDLYGEKYMYTHSFENDIVSIYSYDGKMIGMNKDESIVSCYFGDDKYLLAVYKLSPTKSVNAIIRVDDIIAGKGKWKLLAW